MAITFVAAGSVGTNAAGSGNPTAPGIPAGIATNDLMILVALAGDNVTITLPGGWTKFIEHNDGTAQRLTVAWKAYAGDSAPTVTHAAGNSCVARIWAFRGADTTNPIETSSVNDSTPGTTVTATTITPLAGTSGVIGIWTEECTGNTSGGPTWASYSGTNPTFTEVGTDANLAQTGTNEVSFGFAWGLSNNATATGSRTAVVTGPAISPPTTDIGALFSVAQAAPAASSPAPRPMLLTLQGTPVQPFLAHPVPAPDLTTGATVFNDSGSGTITLSGSIAQSWSVSEAGSGTITLSGTFAQSLSASDSRSGTITLSGTATESFTQSSSGTGTITLSGTAVESHLTSYNDSGSGTITLSGSSTQSLTTADSRAGTITLSGTDSENITHSRSGAGTVTLSGTAVEQFGIIFNDSRSGTLTLSGTVSQSLSATESRSGSIVLSGTATEDFHTPGNPSTSLPGDPNEQIHLLSR